MQSHAYSVIGYGYHEETGDMRFDIRNPWGNKHLQLTFEQLLELDANIRYTNV